jgi:hypothetical protein
MIKYVPSRIISQWASDAKYWVKSYTNFEFWEYVLYTIWKSEASSIKRYI